MLPQSVVYYKIIFNTDYYKSEDQMINPWQIKILPWYNKFSVVKSASTSMPLKKNRIKAEITVNTQ
jgi:hypothetical protein